MPWDRLRVGGVTARRDKVLKEQYRTNLKKFLLAVGGIPRTDQVLYRDPTFDALICEVGQRAIKPTTQYLVFYELFHCSSEKEALLNINTYNTTDPRSRSSRPLSMKILQEYARKAPGVIKRALPKSREFKEWKQAIREKQNSTKR